MSMQHKPATTCVKINALIEERWSPRAFDANQLVKYDDVLALLEAARWAPSCFNDQPWRFIVCDKSIDEFSWQAAQEVLVEKNRQWAKNAPILILAVAMENFNHNGQSNRWAMYDTGAASAAMCLQATALGLIVHQMGGFDEAKARAVFNLPVDCKPMTMIAVGYQADAEVLAEDLKAIEMADRTRKAINERFYFGKWG